MKKTTLAGVAVRAGVTAKTASLALRRGKGAPETVERIRQAAQELGYEARQPRSGGDTILLITPIDHNPSYYVELGAFVRQRLDGDGYRTLHINASGDAVCELTAIDLAIRERVAGALLVSTRCHPDGPRKLSAAGIPTVLVNCRPLAEHLSRVAYVGVDNITGTADAVRQLIDRGHKRIAYLHGPAQSLSEQQRYAGFKQAMEEIGGIQAKYDLELHEPMARFSAGRSAGDQILDVKPRPTAIVVYNDAMAVGCLLAAAEKGLSVPKDLSVIGHDDLSFAKFTTPPLSTVAVNKLQLGRLATDQLLALISGEEIKEAPRIESYFHDRGTTATIPASLSGREKSRAP